MKEIVTPLIKASEIEARVSELAEIIKSDFGSAPITLICILKGGVIFMVDLARKIGLDAQVEFDFMDISSYEDQMESSGIIKINKDLENSIKDKNVLLVEDIIDTGRTLSHLINHLSSQKPNILKVCTLLDKPDRRVINDVNVDYVGFKIPDQFVVGYGLDYAQRYRNLPYIGVLSFEE